LKSIRPTINSRFILSEANVSHPFSWAKRGCLAV
jgi:hypothetical protein